MGLLVAELSKIFGGLMALVLGVYAGGTVLAAKNAKEDPIGDRLRAMTIEVEALSVRIDTIGGNNDGATHIRA